MMAEANKPILSFTCELDDRAIWEIEQKGYFEHALVRLPEGESVRVSFWDPATLAQDLERENKRGRLCIGEPGIIIVPKVAPDIMRAAVYELYARGYFGRLRSLFSSK